MVTWRSELPTFLPKLQDNLRAIQAGVTDALRESIVNGSPETGAPGQPEDLRQDQWAISRAGDLDSTIGTDDSSAPAVENGISTLNGAPITLKSAVGGFHSLALTVQNGERIVKQSVKSVVPDAA